MSRRTGLHLIRVHRAVCEGEGVLPALRHAGGGEGDSGDLIRPARAQHRVDYAVQILPALQRSCDEGVDGVHKGVQLHVVAQYEALPVRDTDLPVLEGQHELAGVKVLKRLISDKFDPKVSHVLED